MQVLLSGSASVFCFVYLCVSVQKVPVNRDVKYC